MLTRLRARLTWPGSRQPFGSTTNRRIFAAAATIGGVTAAVSLASMARELLIAASFGTDDALDAFIVAIVLPTFVVNVIGGSFAAALVPVFVRVDEQEGRDAAQRLFSGVLTLGGGLLILAMGLLAVLSGFLLPLLGSGFDPDKLLLTQRLFYLFLPVVILGGVAAMCSAILNAGNRFALVAASQGLIPLASAIALIVGGAAGIYALLIGAIGGYALRLCVLDVGLARLGLEMRPRLPGKDPELHHIAGQYLPMVVGSALLSSTALVDQAVAATLESGSVAALAYGTKVVALFTGLGATALGTAVLPFFSRMVAAAEWSQIRHTVRTFVALTLLATIPIAIVLFGFSRPIVTLIFQRGAFTEADAIQVAHVQSLFALQLPFFGLGILFGRLLSSLGANRVLMWQAAICVPINVVLDIFLARHLGVAGIALATTLIYVLSLGILSSMAFRALARAELLGAAGQHQEPIDAARSQ